MRFGTVQGVTSPYYKWKISFICRNKEAESLSMGWRIHEFHRSKRDFCPTLESGTVTKVSLGWFDSSSNKLCVQQPESKISMSLLNGWLTRMRDSHSPGCHAVKFLFQRTTKVFKVGSFSASTPVTRSSWTLRFSRYTQLRIYLISI